MRSARGVHRVQLERKCAHNCWMSPGHTPCINCWNAWRLHPTAGVSPHCVTQYQGQLARRMLPRRLLWRRSRQKLHGRLRR